MGTVDFQRDTIEKPKNADVLTPVDPDALVGGVGTFDRTSTSAKNQLGTYFLVIKHFFSV